MILLVDDTKNVVISLFGTHVYPDRQDAAVARGSTAGEVTYVPYRVTYSTFLSMGRWEDLHSNSGWPLSSHGLDTRSTGLRTTAYRSCFVLATLIIFLHSAGSSFHEHAHSIRPPLPAFASSSSRSYDAARGTNRYNGWIKPLASPQGNTRLTELRHRQRRRSCSPQLEHPRTFRGGGALMCGVIGILLADHDAPVSPELYDGLTILQHRGQDAAGIATSDGRKMHLRKDKGLARDVFGVDNMAGLRGSYGVAHVRYPTSGCNSAEEAQPFRNNVPVGFCVAHNGHISNGQQVRDQVRHDNGGCTPLVSALQQLSATRHLNTDSDTELISELFGMELAARRPTMGPVVTADLLFEVVQAVMARCRGGYAVTILVNGFGILAFRDPHGIRPLCVGARRGGGGVGVVGAVGGICSSGGGEDDADRRRGGSGKLDLAVASESAALTGLGFTLKRDVGAGEAVFMDVRTGSVTSRVCDPVQQAPERMEGGMEAGKGKRGRFKPCLFEYVYMARPDSIVDGIPVYAARVAMGLRLAAKIAREISVEEIDVVVPVPETSRIAAMHCAASLGLPFEEGLTKNRYVGRTFIMPGQAFRQENVRKKLSAVSCVLKGRSVLLVDDSIVRGTTSREIVRIIKEAGASRVYFCSASPPVRHPNCYGIDLPRQSELLANGLGEEEIREAIGADGVVFQDLKDLEDCVSELKPGLFTNGFENSMFTGEYLTSADLIEGDPAEAMGASVRMGSGRERGGAGAPGVVDVI